MGTIVDTMAAVKFLIALACIQVLGAAAFNLDWSKITPKQPRTAGQPHKATKPQQFVAPPLRYGTKNMRAEGCGMPNRPASGQRIVGGWETGINESRGKWPSSSTVCTFAAARSSTNCTSS